VLAGLAERYQKVGVVSGRPAAFLVEHLGGLGVTLSGLYGLESVNDDGPGQGAVIEAAPGVEQWRAVVAEVALLADSRLGPGVVVERKGLSVTLHFRAHPEAGPPALAWAQERATQTGLVVHPGRRCYELRPPVARDKGTVVAEMATGLSTACFLGDDEGDLPAFDSLDRLVDAGDLGCAVRVAVDSAEAPDRLLERADFVVDGPEGSLALLSVLLGRLRGGQR